MAVLIRTILVTGHGSRTSSAVHNQTARWHASQRKHATLRNRHLKRQMNQVNHSIARRRTRNCSPVVLRPHARVGFTLLEILLVVGLMLVLAVAVLPSLRQAVGKGPLQKFSQQFREITSDARTAAIDTGLTYQVRFEIGGQYFVAIPLDPATESLAGETTDENSAGVVPKSVGQMYETLTFRAPEGVDLSGERLDRELFDGLPDAGKLADAVWSPAIRYYPDGSSTDTVLEISDDRKQAVSISIRGLTGATKVSPVFISEDD